MTWYEKTAMILAAIGAINWGLAELGFNLVDLVFSWAGAIFVSIVYYIIALCGIWALVKIFR